jgi:hypothetical protein
MAEIKFSCPTCGHDYEVAAALAGKKARCKVCQEVMRIPEPQPPSSGDEAPSSPGMSFPCPRCGYGFTITPRLAGKRARCKQCGEVFRIPAADDAPVAQPAGLLRQPAQDDDAPGYALAEDPQSAIAVVPAVAKSTRTSQQAAGDDWAYDLDADDPPAARAPAHGLSRSAPDPAIAMSPVVTWLRHRVKVLGLAACLLVLAWAGWNLFPRAWNAGTALLGETEESPNDPHKGGNQDPELELPDIAPDRVDLVREHEHVIEEMARAYGDMARGYASMLNPETFAKGQETVVAASKNLEEAAGKGSALPKLQSSERPAITSTVNMRLKTALGQVAAEVAKLQQNSTVQGDFDTMARAIQQTRQAFDKEYSNDLTRPAVQLVMKRVPLGTPMQIISEKAWALADPSKSGGSGVGFEGDTMKMKVTPVMSARSYADRITFGKVHSVQGRRIELDVDLPTPEEIERYEAKHGSPKKQEPVGDKPSSSPAGAPPAADGTSSSSAAAASSASAGGASIISLRWVDASSDRVGGWHEPSRPDGTKDQHLQVELDLPEGSQLESFVLKGGDHERWETKPTRNYWPLAVYQGQRAIARSYAPEIGSFAGRQSFDLYVNTGMWVKPGMNFDLEAVVAIGGTRHTLTASCKRP